MIDRGKNAVGADHHKITDFYTKRGGENGVVVNKDKVTKFYISEIIKGAAGENKYLLFEVS